ncbi:pyridoxamine 5'-phosphate oxidase family protein [Halopenitus sp. H-Gu1]|uniref:pyridoxamine 5'-phosphate oxidase family protein n=1 Tax=Halopenitus sp. H-Gu1 TaxID=3242697 RepID=UPI00359EBF03
MTDRSALIGNDMNKKECESFLTSRGHGVLSMGVENRGYGIPISYGYDEENGRIILEFVNAPDSKKKKFADTSEEVTVTVYEYESLDSWESVIVTGTIHSLEDATVSERLASLFFAQADDAAGNRRWEDREGIERTWYEIRNTEITGRRSEGLRPRNP